MSHARYDDPDDEEEEYDAEHDYDPETYPAGLYADDGRDTVPCPHCRAAIDEEAEQCPRCGMYLSREDAPAEGKSPVWVILMLLALFAALVMVAGC